MHNAHVLHDTAPASVVDGDRGHGNCMHGHSMDSICSALHDMHNTHALHNTWAGWGRCTGRWQGTWVAGGWRGFSAEAQPLLFISFIFLFIEMTCVLILFLETICYVHMGRHWYWGNFWKSTVLKNTTLLILEQDSFTLRIILNIEG